MIAVIVVESLFIIGVWRLWQRLSDVTQKLLKYGIFTALLITTLSLFHIAGTLERTLLLLSAVCVFIGLDYLLERFDLDWITFDAFALAFGIGPTSMLSNAVAPIVVIPLLILAIIWDHLAVNLSDIMGELIEFSSSTGLPNYLIIPLRLQVNHDAVRDYVQDTNGNEKPPGVAGIIGVGDFALPGMLAVSAWVAGAIVPAIAAGVGTIISMIVLRDSMERVEGGLPALPWLNTGALVGFAAGIVLAGVPLSTALGL